MTMSEPGAGPAALSKILVVEDQPVAQEVLRRTLAGCADLALEFCSDPLLAEPLVVASQPTVILLDLFLPGMDGLELLRRLRYNPLTARIPVIMLTVEENPEIKARAFALGASDYLVKLPDQVELAARLRYHAHLGEALARQRQAEEKYHRIFEQSRDAVFMADVATGIIIDCNPAATRLLKLERERIIGLHQTQLHPAREVDHYRKLFQDHVRDNRHPIQAVVERSDGMRMPVEISAGTFVQEGRVIIFGVFRDISERLRAQEAERSSRRALAASEARLRALLDNSNAVIFMRDLEGRYLLVNRGFEELMRLANHQILGRSVYDLHPPEVARELAGNDRLVISHSGPLQFEETVIIDGERRVYLSTKFPLFDHEGGVEAICGISTDITERKRMEEALRTNGERLRLAIEGTGDGIWDWEIPSGAIEYNAQWGEYLGYAPGERGFDLAWWRTQVDPEQLPEIETFLARYLSGDFSEPFELKYRMRRKSGEWIWIEARGKCVARDTSGAPTRMIGTHRDITQLKLVQERLAEAMNQARAANAAKSRFLSTMSHEIRTPITTILGMGELLAESRLDSTQRHYVGMINRAGGVLLALVSGVLDLSKIEAGHLVLERVAFDVGKLGREVTSFLATQGAAKGLAISCAVDPRLARPVLGDPQRLLQVLVNLLGNAIKFTASGYVKLRVERVAEESCRFVVSDSGIGIPPESLAAIFSPFTQVDASTTRRYGGTGLGLAICRELVTHMGGTITVASQPGQGSSFEFTIPLPEAPEGETRLYTIGSLEGSGSARSQPQPRGAGEDAPTPEPRSPLRILFADDSDDNRLLVRAFLAGSDHQLRVTTNGEEAVQRFLTERFDLVLMDMQMPVMDGYTAVRRIRELELERGGGALPIVAITADSMVEDVQRALEAGCDLHLSKPFNKQGLLETIARCARWTAGAGG